MNSSPDKLFRDRIESLESAPPAAAWNRVSVNLKNQRRRKSIIRWSSLGLLALFIVAGTIILSHTSPASSTPVPQKPERSNLPMAAVTPSTPIEREPAATENPVSIVQAPKKSIATQRKEKYFIATDEIMTTGITAKETSVDPALTQTIAESAIPLSDAEEKTPMADHSVDQAEAISTTIVYTANDVARFKRKPKPTPIDTARSTLQRVIDVAYEIKHENTWLGDFRQMKDELLSRPGNGPARDK